MLTLALIRNLQIKLVCRAPIDPLLGPLADNGGPTLTHAIQPGSPAVNRGDPAAPPRDQRGYGRLGVPDVGAFEFNGIPPAPLVTTNNATNVAGFSATLNGSLNPRASTTTVYFQYGLTTSYGSNTPMQTRTGNTVQPISANISGLSASTTVSFAHCSPQCRRHRLWQRQDRYHSWRHWTSGCHNQSGKQYRQLFSHAQWLSRSPWTDHDCLFSVWNNDQLRAHQRDPE